jgi:D-alanine-D-alanine ligase
VPRDCTEPALPALVTAALNSYVSKLWQGLGCHGVARADFIAAGDGTVCALEVNTTPGMSYESNFIAAAGLLGFGHADVVIAILREDLTRPRYDAPSGARLHQSARAAQLILMSNLGGCPPVVAGP